MQIIEISPFQAFRRSVVTVMRVVPKELRYVAILTLVGGAGLAIARALLRLSPAELLILDEPTANLDPKTEHEIYNILRTLAKGRIGYGAEEKEVMNVILPMPNAQFLIFILVTYIAPQYAWQTLERALLISQDDFSSHTNNCE
jgi:ABC-type taurine transport system ATPase subunit